MASGKKNRRHMASNLAFLDVMSCGFGAAILLFLLIKHGTMQATAPDAESARLKQDIAERSAEIASIEADISELQDQVSGSRARLADVEATMLTARQEAAGLRQASVELSGKIEDAKKALSAAEAAADKKEKDSRIKVKGQSTQQFLTGLAVKGNHIVIVIDRSASMLDDKILNVVRRRAMGGDMAAKAPKWERTQRIARWLTNKVPEGSWVRFVSFAETANTIPADGWIRANQVAQVTAALEKAIEGAPTGGTNLYRAFESVKKLSPAADAIYLVTDGLPTQGKSKPRGNTVSGKQRRDLFQEAVRSFSGTRAHINVILLPMEGDPDAAASFWGLSRATGGRMLSPSETWP